MFDRRALLQRTLGAALAMGLGAAVIAADDDDQVVLVRQLDGTLVMVTRNDVLPVREPLPASPAATPAASASPVAIPARLEAAVTEGTVGYWMGTSDGSAYVFRLDTGASSTWWWLGEGHGPVRLPLPDDLEPALPSGTVARWFHGAVVNEEHLGEGTLRLMAVDIATGEIVLDHELDRRLELAATTVTPGGEVVAHAQGVAGGVEFWVADLRTGVIHESGSFDPAATVAPSSIDLKAATEGDRVLVAAGLDWGAPGQPAPLVVVERYVSPNASGGYILYGDLVAIVPASTVEVDTEG